MEQYAASGAQSRPHAELALQHGIAIHRPSLEWTRLAAAALAEPSPASKNPGAGTGESAKSVSQSSTAARKGRRVYAMACVSATITTLAQTWTASHARTSVPTRVSAAPEKRNAGSSILSLTTTSDQAAFPAEDP